MGTLHHVIRLKIRTFKTGQKTTRMFQFVLSARQRLKKLKAATILNATSAVFNFVGSAEQLTRKITSTR